MESQEGRPALPSPAEGLSPSPPPSREPVVGPALSPEERLEDYLDHLVAPLVDCVPYPERRRLRAEWRGHLLSLAAARQEAGVPPEAAVAAAVDQFGAPDELERMWRLEWGRERRGSWGASPVPAVAVSLALFGLAALWLAPGRWAAEGSGYPESDPGLWLMTLAPVLVGVLAGLLSPARQVIGVLVSLAVLVLTSYTYAGWMSLRGSQDSYALVVGLLLWLPTGVLGTLVGRELRRRMAGIWPSRTVSARLGDRASEVAGIAESALLAPITRAGLCLGAGAGVGAAFMPALDLGVRQFVRFGTSFDLAQNVALGLMVGGLFGLAASLLVQARSWVLGGLASGYIPALPYLYPRTAQQMAMGRVAGQDLLVLLWLYLGTGVLGVLVMAACRWMVSRYGQAAPGSQSSQALRA